MRRPRTPRLPGRRSPSQRVSAQARLLALLVGGVVTTALLLGGVGIVQAQSFSAQAHRHVEELVDTGLDRTVLDAATLVEAQSRSVQAGVDDDLVVARHVLQNAGPVRFAGGAAPWPASGQFTGAVSAAQLPTMLLGQRPLGMNADPAVETPVVDEVRRLVGGNASVFRRVNEQGDLLRVATNARTRDGRRAVGTYVPARDGVGTANPVAAAIRAGRTYRGVVYAVDQWYISAYEPIRDGRGRVVGALGVGAPQDVLGTVQDALAGTPVGRNGTLSVLRGTGAHSGQDVFSPGRYPGSQADVLRARQTALLVDAADGLGRGQVAGGTYTATGPDGEQVPMLYRVAYYAPWDWVLALEAPQVEFEGAQEAVDAGQRVMTWTLVLVGLAVAVLGGGLAAALARRLTRLQAQLTRQAFYDPLTGLANRTLFTERAGRVLLDGQRRGTLTGALFVDLDDFKTVNDSLGHDTGDALLVQVAERLSACLRPGDLAARLGGDEFCVLLEDLRAAAAAEDVAERLLQSLRAPFLLSGNLVGVRASIGVATGLDDAAELLSAADAAMYVAKASGKGCYEVFQPSMGAAVTERLHLLADLQQAVERDELVLHYQPTVDLDTGAITGAEALVRWQHPARGLVPPLEFIPVAEEAGLIVPIGRWVLRQACRQAAAWRRDHPGLELGLAVNLSGVQLLHPECTADVRAALADSGLPPHALTLEITESVLMADDAELRLSALKRLGVGLAIDDFGTGYSSLSYLRRFPIDLLKLDKSFVDGIAEGGERLVLVQGIIELGQALGLRTLAEGVETSAQRRQLVDLRCGSGQGYHFARPLPAAELDGLLRRGVPLGEAESLPLTS